jgi:hypothetical protein
MHAQSEKNVVKFVRAPVPQCGERQHDITHHQLNPAMPKNKPHTSGCSSKKASLRLAA